ncbi:hypothetical protein B0I37DRAFT_404633 [Chaetomium sp. MPI-CAGE-AT-0009]|nr:hypothetical protein B0I37DRAFT_404633 [Chaetomium sp. MPI-CAGE-AT-0009]
MPYDPDWDLEEETSSNLNTLGAAAGDEASPSEYDSNEMMYEEGEGEGEEGEDQADYDQEPEDVEGEGHTVAELPANLPHSDRSQVSGQHQDTTPRNRQPFPGAPAAGRLPRVEVVLHSSPRRVPFTAPAGELAGNMSDEPNLITSDIVPNPVNNQQLAAKAQVGPPKMQPPAAPAPAPAPFKLPDITPQPKKRGRPVGWRRGHGSYAAMRSGLPPESATPRPTPKPADEQKVRRRPGRKPAPTARQVYLKLNPHFIAFRCEWEGCPAELQNLETLRKHLLVVHGRPSRSSRSSPTSPSPSPTAQQQHTTTLPCKWASCTSAPLNSRESFASHIETAHLLPFRWHVGDGPRNTTPPLQPAPTTTTTTTTTITNNNSNNNPLPTYLFNAAGEQVTPSVAGQQIENEDDRKRRQARVNRVLVLRDQHAPDEPEYGERELQIIGEVLGAKRARQRMLREYAERGCQGGWRP